MIFSRISLFFGLVFLVGYQANAQEDIDILSFKNKITEIRIATKSSSDSLSITNKNSSTPILGSWGIKGNRAIFKPLIPLAAGKKFLVFRNGVKTDSILIEREKQAPPSVLAFYPSADTLPENLLKCYVSFSQPMRDNNIYDLLSVIDDEGKIIEDVFLPLKPALWNKEQTVLTLWIDPGRVKRDLIRNKNLGAPLVNGRNYSIKISSEWQAAKGEKLLFDFRKYFYISERDEGIPNSSLWQVITPKPFSSGALIIEFTESMDYRTTLDGIVILKGDQPIQGKSSLRLNEKRWVFIPDSQWQNGSYRIKIASNIEDNAGNNLLRPFDNDLSKSTDIPFNPLEINFTIE